MNRLRKNWDTIIYLIKLVLVTGLIFCYENESLAQYGITSSLDWTRLNHSQISGLRFQEGIFLNWANRSGIELSLGITYAKGKRGFSYLPGEHYTLADLNDYEHCGDDYYWCAKFKPDVLFSLGLRPATTIESSAALKLYHSVIKNQNIDMQFYTGLTVFWIDKKYVYAIENGKLTIKDDVWENINLVTTYHFRYADIGPVLGARVFMKPESKLSLGIHIEYAWHHFSEKSNHTGGIITRFNINPQQEKSQ